MGSWEGEDGLIVRFPFQGGSDLRCCWRILISSLAFWEWVVWGFERFPLAIDDDMRFTELYVFV